jgi:hypothetical protein
MTVHEKIPARQSHREARAVAGAMKRSPRTGRASRAALAFERAVSQEIIDGLGNISVATAAEILSGLRTDAGRDAVTLVALGLDWQAAAYDTERSGRAHLNRVFDKADPLRPTVDHDLALQVITHLCGVAPDDVRHVVLAQGAFLAWFLQRRDLAIAFLNRAIEANPEAMTEYRLGAVVHQDAVPGYTHAARSTTAAAN